MKRKFLALLLSFCMALSLLPVSALAEGGDESSDTSATPVAKIGENTYETLNAAIKAAQDGDTIVLLSDCKLSADTKVAVTKDITIQGTGEEVITVTAEKLPGDRMIEIQTNNVEKGLTLKDCNVNVSNIPASGYAYNAVIIINGGKLVLDNCDMTLDGLQSNGTYNNMHGFWCLEGGDNLLSVTNGSNLLVQNFAHNALEWDGTTNYYFKVKDSTYTADHTRGGIIGTWNVTFENAIVNVMNSSTNGSNGSHYVIKDSVVNYTGNGAHGLSAGKVEITDSLVTCQNNGYTGFHVAQTFDVKTTGTGKYDTKIEVTGNSNKAYGNDLFAGLRLIGNATIGAGVTMNVSDNYGVGIRASGTSATYSFDKDVDLTVMRNGKAISGTQYNTTGGGIWNKGTMTLPEDAVIYNNHATTAGDDIYNTGTITFGAVGSDWRLDGDEDNIGCSDAIDGWYYDGQAGTRWGAHNPYYVFEYTTFEDGVATITGSIALKAAHGISSVVPEISTPDWKISKSKTATNLDSNYESKVTLSLPSAEAEMATDIVFVLDKSTSADLEKEALDMLEALQAQIKDTDAKVNVGVVIFNKKANVTELKDLATEYETIKTAITEDISSGTNTHAGLLAGIKLLEDDTSVADDHKYLIFVSDGITYIFDDGNGNATSIQTTSYESNAGSVVTKTSDTMDTLYMKYPYYTDFITAAGGVEAYLSKIGVLIAADGKDYWGTYGGTYTTSLASNRNGSDLILDNEKFADYVGKNSVDSHANNIDTALYLTYQAYQSAASRYHCYAMLATTENHSETYPWATTFMNYLAGDKDVTFTEIQKDITYLVDAGSKVEDYMGYVANEYDFDFVNDASALSLKVGDQTYEAVKLADNQYGFKPLGNGNYAYTLVYDKGNGTTEEHFTWNINEPITNFNVVQLTYTVKLTNPQKTAGTYGDYDADGSKGYSGLYTNNSATLYPVDSNGNQGDTQEFPKPTVSYEVKAEKPTKPTNPTNPTTPVTPPPALNTEDHFAYIIGYPVDYYTGEPTDDQTKKPVKPEGNITRAEVATIFFRLLTDEVRNEYWSQTCEYSDVDIDDWFNNAVCTLSNFGILKGYEDGTFRPNGNITRAEFATIAVRFFEVEYNGKDLFPDIDGHWAQDYINQAGFAGLVEGYPDGTFGPEKLITRAEAVTIVNRTIDRHPDKEHLLDDMLVWPDNMDTTKWYYADMQEATNSHEYTMHTKTAETESQTKYEIWQKILPVRDWEAFEKAWADANAAANPGEVVR